MARNIRVAIIGAGLGGLAAAGALRQHGIEVVVYERAPQLGEVGAGIQLAPNAVKVLRALGLEAGAAGGQQRARQVSFRSPGTMRACVIASR